MEQRFIVNPFKCMIGAISCLCLIAISGCMIPIQRWGSAVVFLLLGLIFGVISVLNGAVVQINSTGIRKSILGIRTKELLWTEIQEVGVTGTKAFNRNHPEKTGGLYLYFSQTPMTEQERFDMVLKWPPIGKIYLTYNKKRINTILCFWNQKIQTHNVGDLIL